MAYEKKKYMTNKELYIEITISRALGKLTPRAAHLLMLLGRNVVKKMYYRNPDDREDCLQEAMLNVFKFWYNFDERKGDNAFAYFTEIIKRGLAKAWNNLHKTKGEDVEIISLSGYDESGNSYDRL